MAGAGGGQGGTGSVRFFGCHNCHHTDQGTETKCSHRSFEDMFSVTTGLREACKRCRRLGLNCTNLTREDPQLGPVRPAPMPAQTLPHTGMNMVYHGMQDLALLAVQFMMQLGFALPVPPIPQGTHGEAGGGGAQSTLHGEEQEVRE